MILTFQLFTIDNGYNDLALCNPQTMRRKRSDYRYIARKISSKS